jgi:hypothetical protein
VTACLLRKAQFRHISGIFVAEKAVDQVVVSVLDEGTAVGADRNLVQLV